MDVEVTVQVGEDRLVTIRFSSMYDTPDGTRRLSSSTCTVPSESRTRSQPQMCAHTPPGGRTATRCGRKFADPANTSAGNTPSRTTLAGRRDRR